MLRRILVLDVAAEDVVLSDIFKLQTLHGKLNFRHYRKDLTTNDDGRDFGRVIFFGSVSRCKTTFLSDDKFALHKNDEDPFCILKKLLDDRIMSEQGFKMRNALSCSTAFRRKKKREILTVHSTHSEK